MNIFGPIFEMAVDDFIQFKTNRQNEEWDSGKLSEKLQSIVRLLAIVAYFLFKKKITITDIYRTQEENDKIYNWSKDSRRKRKYSVHTFWRGVDIRVNKRSLTHKEAVLLRDIANVFVYDKKRKSIKTAVYGNDKLHINHIHLQTKA